MENLHIIEPTLADLAGHCYSYVQRLLETHRAAGIACQIWLDRRGQNLYPHYRLQLQPYFYRRFRKLQKFFCLRQLVRRQQTIFIPTAGRLDFILLDHLLKNLSPSRLPKIFLHFHQVTMTEKKRIFFKKIAARYKNMIILAPTQKLLDIFEGCGFAHCEYVPYPGTMPDKIEEKKNIPVFRHLVYAGSARADKGFPELVTLIAYLSAQSIALPLTVQVSPPASGRYDKQSQAALRQLQNVSRLNANLILYKHTLDPIAYQNLFYNGICLLIYDPVSYQNKFSGVALDALYSGCPIITVDNTWMGEIIKRFDAGVILTNRTPICILQAVQQIRDNYLYYTERAKQAAHILQQEHDPMYTWQIIKKYL